MVKLKDIALRCGVSIATASKAINRMPGVGAANADRIRQVAIEMGYPVQKAPRHRKDSPSQTIAVLLEDENKEAFTHHYFALVMESFKEAVKEKGYDLLLLNRSSKKQPIGILERIRRKRVDGLFLACTDFYDPEILELANSGIPLLSLDHSFKDHPSVLSNNKQALMDAVRFAYQQGHRHIAYIAGQRASITEDRVAGYRAGLEEVGLSFQPEYLVYARFRDLERTQSATRLLINLASPPTCIIFPDDYAILGGVMAIQAQGLRIPEHISMIGFDGIPIMQHIHPRLTTLWQDGQEIGRTAAKLLLQHIEKKTRAEDINQPVQMPVMLLPGETVANLLNRKQS